LGDLCHPTYGLSINYPYSWQIDESNPKYIRLGDARNLIGMDVEIITNIPSTVSVESLVNANIKQYQTDKPDFKLLSKVQKTLW